MPYMLRFHDTDDGTELPDPAQVGHAAAWAAERGYWDVATCLMELAHALAELETPAPAPGPAGTFAEQRAAYDARDPRYVDQAAPHPESRLTRALATARELPHPNAPTCSHGYATGQDLAGARYHLATDGSCNGHIVLDAPE